MPTWRAFRKQAYHGGLYEAQDVFAEIDDIDLIPLAPKPGLAWRERFQRRLLWHDVSRQLVRVNPGLQPVTLDRDYDLFVLVCQNWWDVLYINAIKGWKDRCRVSICYIDEIWGAFMHPFRYWLHALRDFDHVILGLDGTVEPMRRAIGGSVHYVPGGVDAIRFTPYPRPAPRTIDLYSIGRRYPKIHQALLDLSAQDEYFYLYDSVGGADGIVEDHRQHRSLLASTAKRSRCFMVGPAKMGVVADTHGQVEIGYRYFEGAAAGTVMVGRAPDCKSFRELFDWPDVVVELEEDGSDARAVLKQLANDPDRVDTISRRNAANALLRHDWSYRWNSILGIAGLQPLDRFHARQMRLRDLAAMAADRRLCESTCR
jgi:hypothetical protein